MLFSDLAPSAWYLVVTCPQCKTRQALFRDWTHGQILVTCTYGHTCDACHTFNLYDPPDVELYRHLIEGKKPQA